MVNRLESSLNDVGIIIDDFDKLRRETWTSDTRTGESYFRVDIDPKAAKDIFYELRTRCVLFLKKLPAEQKSVTDLISEFQSMDFNEYSMLHYIDRLHSIRSDIEVSLGELNARITLLNELMTDIQASRNSYVRTETDCIEKRINAFAREIFGEDSPQMKEVHKIFHPSVGVFSFDPQVQQRRNDANWTQNKKLLENSLVNMIETLERTIQVSLTPSSNKSENSYEVLNVQDVKKEKWLNEPRATVISAVIQAIAAVGAVIVAALITYALTRNAIYDNSLVLTFTPVPAVTSTSTYTSTPIPTTTPTALPSPSSTP